MVSSTEIKENLSEFMRIYPTDSLAVKLMRQLCEFVLQNDHTDECPLNNGYLHVEHFCDSYPILKKGTLLDFVRHSDQPCVWNKRVGKEIYVHPKEFLRYIRNNKRKFFKIYSRADRNNFYGFFDEEREYNGN